MREIIVLLLSDTLSRVGGVSPHVTLVFLIYNRLRQRAEGLKSTLLSSVTIMIHLPAAVMRKPQRIQRHRQ